MMSATEVQAAKLTWDEAMAELENAKAHLQQDVNPKVLMRAQQSAELAWLAMSRLEDAVYGPQAEALYARFGVREAELEAAVVMEKAAKRLEDLAETYTPWNQRGVDSVVGAQARELRAAVRRIRGGL